MLTKLQALGTAVLCGLFASAACSSSNGDGGLGSTAGAGAGGTAGRPTSNGGRGGTSSAHAGSAGKASGAASGKGGTAGGSAEGGEAGQTAACPGCASGFCLADGTCVDCLPSNDHCPATQYCTDANTCAPGCKANGANCASGVCSATHDCKSCISDDECGGGRLCGGGECAAACTAGQEGGNVGCGDGLTCCSAHCTDVKTDSHHCGACGTTCGGSQFCGLTECTESGAGGEGGAGSEACVSCHDLTLANVCSIANAIVILDTNKNSNEGNRVPGRAIGAALEAQCNPAPVVSEEEQDSQDALNITTGHPVSGGGTLLIVAGGPFYQNLEGYFEQSVSPLYYTQDGDTQQFTERKTGGVIVSRSVSADNLSHDLFIIQFMRDSGSGSLVLNAQGFWESGTVAATYEMLNVILPAVNTYDKAWYAYEWTDMNGDKAPGPGEITLKASGVP